MLSLNQVEGESETKLEEVLKAAVNKVKLAGKEHCQYFTLFPIFVYSRICD